MFKKFKKMSSGKKAGVIITCLVILGLIGYVAYNNFKPQDLVKYNVSEVYKGDIQTTYETTGTVVSSNSVKLQALEGVIVDSVNVSVGDVVEEGDVLATFDVTPLKPTLEEYRKAYSKAKSAYDTQAKQISDVSSSVSSAKQEITRLNNEIAVLEAEIAVADSAVDTSAAPDAQYSSEQIAAITEKLQNGGFTPQEIAGIVSSLQSSAQGITREDLEAAIENSTATKRVELAAKQSQRQLYETQITVYGNGIDDTALSIYKSVMDQKKADYDNYKALVDAMSDGWTAKGKGIITEVNLVAGEPFKPVASQSTTTDISSILGYVSGNADMSGILGDIMGSISGNNAASATGIALENNEELIAEFSVGKYDILKIKTGQKVKVISLGSEYEGEVIYVSATANETSAFDISSIASTFTGGSSSSASGALVRVKIINPDEKIIIGFDVDVRIDTERIEDVLVIPIDAVVTEDGLNYVYTLDEENRVHKTEVVVGNYSDNDYELISGVEAGMKVVDNPKTTIVEGEKISPDGIK